ncbi:hypothetical protein [Rhodococcus sp. HS-D2]|uniref:hypothetical protein n=1 Tax=Rhodococcus sp. HS-D2 TaxID=1384636 RepID=UPI0007D94EBB|nr:hypothetical protein [Rhodococcus sp. HS-D2]
MPSNPHYRAVRKTRRLAAQVGAIHQLHSDHDGTCTYCGTPFPCDTRLVMRTAREAIDTPAGERDEAMAASRATVESILTVREAYRYSVPVRWVAGTDQDVFPHDNGEQQ